MKTQKNMSVEETTPSGSAKCPEEMISPGKNLLGAALVGLLAMLTMFFSLRLSVPGSLYTAPGLLPFIVGATLLLMAFILAVQAIQAGALSNLGKVSISSSILHWSEEAQRRLLLAVLIVAYVLLVAFVNIDFRIPFIPFNYQISSYEVISVIMVTYILKIFWKGSLVQCLLITTVLVESLTIIFRYGFGILMPETF
tara:strand:+ start:439 stop:1029 length:591 start_codon:yes stop_codon:yes gene_type:complete